MWMLTVGLSLGCASQSGGSGPSAGARETSAHVALRVAVSDVNAASRTARAAVRRRSGYIEIGHEQADAATYELRVPATDLDALRDDLARLGDVTNESEEATDVTEEHTVVSAHVASAHAEQQRLAQMMATHTASLTDVLAVEHELSRVSESIEQWEAQDRDLQGRVAMASLSLEIVRAEPAFGDAPIAELASAASFGATIARRLAMTIVVVVASSAPSLVVLVACGLFFRALLRAWRRFGDRWAATSPR
jgi:hypothetical protein